MSPNRKRVGIESHALDMVDRDHFDVHNKAFLTSVVAIARIVCGRLKHRVNAKDIGMVRPRLRGIVARRWCFLPDRIVRLWPILGRYRLARRKFGAFRKLQLANTGRQPMARIEIWTGRERDAFEKVSSAER